jgi:triosephosphate isomerase
MNRNSSTEGPSGTIHIGVSTKMYLGYQASLRWLEQVRDVIEARPSLWAGGPVDVFVIPSFPVLESARRILDGLPVRLGAQNCSWGDGPLTGEVSAGMLAEMGVSLVEIGHAERRSLFGEDDTVVARKVTAALAAGLTPLLCVGERTRMAPEEAARVCAEQVAAALFDRDARVRAGAGPLVVAYEPLWSIGAPAPADPAYVNQVVTALRAALPETIAADIAIIYGGAAGPALLDRLPTVDGLFLGRFAHDPANLGTVIDEALASMGLRARHPPSSSLPS